MHPMRSVLSYDLLICADSSESSLPPVFSLPKPWSQELLAPFQWFSFLAAPEGPQGLVRITPASCTPGQLSRTESQVWASESLRGIVYFSLTQAPGRIDLTCRVLLSSLSLPPHPCHCLQTTAPITLVMTAALLLGTPRQTLCQFSSICSQDDFSQMAGRFYHRLSFPPSLPLPISYPSAMTRPGPRSGEL